MEHMSCSQRPKEGGAVNSPEPAVPVEVWVERGGASECLVFKAQHPALSCRFSESSRSFPGQAQG